MRCVDADLRRMAEAVVERARRRLGARSDRGGGRGAPVRALRRGREAPRGSAGRRQPRIRRHQKGFAGERQRLLRPPCALLRYDR
jgi:hypothetical protein